MRGGVWFSSGNVEIHISKEQPLTPAKKAYPAFLVENLQNLKELLLEKGIQIIEDMHRPDAHRFIHS